MQGSHVELILALQFDKAHRRPCRCFCNPLGVAIIVLLRLDVRADIFGRHQPDLMAVSGEHATQMMGAAAGLHSNNARRKLLSQSIRASRLTLRRMTTARPIEADDAADVLAQIHAKERNIHSHSSF
jgi:hypothetical protein